MSKYVIVLGASRYYAKAIEAVRIAGYRVIAVDRNPESPGFAYADESEVCDIIDFDGVERIAKKWNASAIIPLNDYGVMTAAVVSEKLGLIGISPHAAELSTKKSMMRQAWSAAGVVCPLFEIVKKGSSLRDAIHRVGYPCILKPAIGCGGASRGVIVVRSEGEVNDAIAFTLGFYDDQTTLVEGFVESVSEHSAEVLIYGGEVHVITVADKIKTPLPYRVDKDVLYPTSIEPSLLEKVNTDIAKAVKALNVNVGAAHIEFAIDASGEVVFFEMGARCGGGGTSAPIVPYVTGVDLCVELVRILSGDTPVNLAPLYNKGCCYHFITPKPGVITSLEGEEAMRSSNEVLDAAFFYEAGDMILSVTVGSERSGFIIAGGESRQLAYDNACKAEGYLTIEIQ